MLRESVSSPSALISNDLSQSCHSPHPKGEGGLFLEAPGWGGCPVSEPGNQSREPAARVGCWPPVSALKASPAPRGHVTNTCLVGEQAADSLQSLPLDSKNAL